MGFWMCPFNVSFERFFNPERADMPDIDMVVWVLLYVQFHEVPPDRNQRRLHLIALFTLSMSIYNIYMLLTRII